MGWSSGSMLANDLWLALRKYIAPDKREMIARRVVDLFETYDCDTLSEAEVLMRDAQLPRYKDKTNA
jgi:hypothetical protein